MQYDPSPSRYAVNRLQPTHTVFRVSFLKRILCISYRIVYHTTSAGRKII